MMKFAYALLIGAAVSVGGAGLAAEAEAASVDLSGYVNSDASFYTGGDAYPTGGPLDINGVHFELSTFAGGLGVIANPDVLHTTAAITTAITGLSITGNTVYTIINSAFGESPMTIGSVVFIDTNNNHYAFDLTEGDNVRDHYNGVYNNDAPNVYGTAQFQSASPGLSYDRLDVQRFVLPSLVTLQEIDFIDNGLGLPAGGSPFLAAITVATTPIPASLPLLATALAGLGGIGWRRRRKAA
jgi:hypothetical protein